MAAFVPIISPDIFALRADYRALSIHALNVRNAVSTPEATTALTSAITQPVRHHGLKLIVKHGELPTGPLGQSRNGPPARPRHF